MPSMECVGRAEATTALWLRSPIEALREVPGLPSTPKRRRALLVAALQKGFSPPGTGFLDSKLGC